jgi:two-component system OmpR family sensor kinase
MEAPINTASEPLNPPMGSPQAAADPHPRWYGWLVLLAVGPLLLLILKLFPALDQPMLHNALVHVLVVGGASMLGMGLALFLLEIAYRMQDGRVYLVGMGFLSIASIFFIHAISTPNVLMAGRGLATTWSSLLSLVLGGVFFALSGLEISARLNRGITRYARAGLLLYLIFWLAYSLVFLILIAPAPAAAQSSGGAAIVTPMAAHVEHAYQLSSDDVRTALVIVGLLCYVLAAGRHFRFYRRSPSTSGLAILCSIVIFGEALLTQQLSQVYSTTFWLYHLEEFIGFGMLSYAGIIAYQRGQARVGLLESLFLVPTRARIQVTNTQAMDALVEMLSRGEQPTPAQLQELQRQAGLSESQVRVLEQAALAVAQERRQRQELERLNTALRQLEQDKDQLMQMVVHDLKNPLTALIGFLEILRMDQLTHEQMLLLDGALRSGKNLSGLISDLLDVGRIAEGQLDLDRSFFPLRDLLTDCAAELSAWLAQDGKTIRIETPSELPLLYADLRLIRRVLLNLLSNAIKHTPPGTHITMRAYSHSPSTSGVAAATQGAAPELAIEVEDTGPGIPPEFLERIFEKFGRVNNGETHSRQDSTGLGLTFCRLAVEAHGGTIDLSSIVDQGTTFRITLPAK